jgi:hypothetical protein
MSQSLSVLLCFKRSLAPEFRSLAAAWQFRVEPSNPDIYEGGGTGLTGKKKP